MAGSWSHSCETGRPDAGWTRAVGLVRSDCPSERTADASARRICRPLGASKSAANFRVEGVTHRRVGVALCRPSRASRLQSRTRTDCPLGMTNQCGCRDCPADPRVPTRLSACACAEPLGEESRRASQRRLFVGDEELDGCAVGILHD